MKIIMIKMKNSYIPIVHYSYNQSVMMMMMKWKINKSINRENLHLKMETVSMKIIINQSIIDILYNKSIR